MTSAELWQSYIFNDPTNVMTNFSYMPLFCQFCERESAAELVGGNRILNRSTAKIIAN